MTSWWPPIREPAVLNDHIAEGQPNPRLWWPAADLVDIQRHADTVSGMGADKKCNGERDCPAEVHIHHCDEDTDNADCNQPWEHANRDTEGSRDWARQYGVGG